MPLRSLKWLAVLMAAIVALPVLLVLGLVLFGANWARGPLQDLALRRTGRQLLIRGDLTVRPGWPAPRVTARSVSFANPAWATEPQMVLANAAEVTLDLPALLYGRLAFPEVRLVQPRVVLEAASGGRKTWLLDGAQTDEATRIPIGRLLLDQGTVAYRDAVEGTDVRVALYTRSAALVPAATAAAGAADEARPLVFSASGLFRHQPFSAQGEGGALLRWRDASLPYPLQVHAAIGSTRLQAEGHVTGLYQLDAVDLQLAVQGTSLAALSTLIGIALPPTPAYQASGHLVHSGPRWAYEGFSGRLGRSDMAGSLQVVTGGARPLLSGAVASRSLDLADLGPAVGLRPSGAVTGALAPARVLPDLPLDTSRWASLDADVSLKAQHLLHLHALPLADFQVRLRLQDRRLTLEPIAFGVAGGRFEAQVALDGRSVPMRGQVRMTLRSLQLARLLPALDTRQASIGRVDGDAQLSGQGASIGRMLATADGHLGLVAQKGEISRLLMEESGLHLLEILRLNLTGDQRVQLNCAVADFKVVNGVMAVQALVLDTSINTLTGAGRIDLAHEAFDLTFTPRTKVSSLVALRSPFYLRGSFAKPVVTLDTRRIVARGAGALALGLVNPLLALVPLFDAGPGAISPCRPVPRATPP